MIDGYALQVAGILAGMSVACLTALTIAATIFNRHGRADAARDGESWPGAGSPSGRLADPPHWIRAFSSEVDAGSREENATLQ